MESCFYEGVVHHQRLIPVAHRFQYGLYLHYLDLDEVPALCRAGLLAGDGFGAAVFRRGDHLGESRRPLADCVADLVWQRTGVVLEGPIRLLTAVRNFGYYFSPLNLYFCLAADGVSTRAVVAEVQNTPWLQRHWYVLWDGNRTGAGVEQSYRHSKDFHVSPFLGMDLDYGWRIRGPGERLTVAIDNVAADGPVFRAALKLRRVALCAASRRQLLCRYPAQTARISAAIYLQAFHLWRKRCPFYPHPRHGSPAAPSSVPASSARALSSASSVTAC